jgi:hypothetical protein
MKSQGCGGAQGGGGGMIFFFFWGALGGHWRFGFFWGGGVSGDWGGRVSGVGKGGELDGFFWDSFLTYFIFGVGGKRDFCIFGGDFDFFFFFGGRGF